MTSVRRQPSEHELVMFPLGTVLLPGELLPLHVFEHRYRVMMAELLGDADARPATAAGELGIVLIERGREVGGGDERFDVACLARVVRSERSADGRYAIVVVGIAPVTISRWLDDDPYPRAIVVERHDEGDREGHGDEATAAHVREQVESLAHVVGAQLDATVLAGGGDTLVHRVASLIGVGPLDRQRLLAANGAGARIELLVGLLDDAIALATLHRDDPPPQ